MAYIGQSIKNGTFTDLSFTGTFNSSTTDFNLGTQVGSAAQLLVSKNGVIQRPGTDYTLATGGTQISFTTAPASGDSIFIVEISGAVGGPMNRDINGDELILDVDGDTTITADTDDQIDFKAGGTDRFVLSSANAKFNVGAYNAEATLTDASTISWDVSTSPVAKVTLGGNRTLGAATNAQTGQFISLLIIQDSTGSRTVTFNAAYEFTEDTAPTLTTTASKGDLFVFRYNGSKFLEVGRNLNLTLS
nr:hypothetical protein [uncultured Mediterranean phage uvMED]